jgi:periplasmic divalent cation tolerance protein
MDTVEGLCQVVTTVGTKGEALDLAGMAVGRRLAACCQVTGPVSSVYRWKDEVHTEEEWLCTMKTPKDSCGALVEFVALNHGYETPEILVLDVAGTTPGYMSWAVSETGGT